MTHPISAYAIPAPDLDPSPKVDIGIVTIRDDEFRAVLAVFPDSGGTFKGARTQREYTLREADAGKGARYRLAVLRQIEQGNGEAQSAARDLIEDFAPQLILVVGIAGGVPAADVTLGDVVLSTRIHDFAVEARSAGEDPTYSTTGGPIAKALAAAIANLPAREAELGDWSAELPAQPHVSWSASELYGPREWQDALRTKLQHRYGGETARRAPIYADGPIASSDRLVKDPVVLIPLLQTARKLLAVEMESGGVYRAAQERCPMLAIRAISDIVGLNRADAWTKYACASAAAFTCAFLRTRPIEPTSVASRAVEASYGTSKTDTSSSYAVSSINPMRVAASILGGDILRAIEYTEPSTGARRIAAVRRTSAKDLDIRVHLLEEVGATCRCIWSSEDHLFSFNDTKLLEVEDIDQDGTFEVIFSDVMYGTHQNSRFLYVYFPTQRRLFSVSEHFNPSWLARPPAPSVLLDPEPPKEVRKAIIQAAAARGFLNFVEEDLDHPDSAMRRWFRDNGHAPQGAIVVHEYDGRPPWGDAADMLVVGNMTWYAYFKGPLICYDDRSDRHYVAYVPADRYSCAKRPVWDGASVWFGIHVEDGLGRFHEASKTLQRVKSVGAVVLPHVEELTFDEKERQLVINRSFKLDPDAIPLRLGF
jgi:nucleoside phosphorylase